MKVHFAAAHPVTGQPIAITYNEMGYTPISMEVYSDLLDKYHWGFEITESAIEASMFGWDAPCAKKAIDAAEEYINMMAEQPPQRYEEIPHGMFCD